MASIHTHKAFHVARRLGAAAAINRDHWDQLMACSKRELAEVVMHLSALATGEYDDALADGRAFARFREEYDALKSNRLI